MSINKSPLTDLDKHRITRILDSLDILGTKHVRDEFTMEFLTEMEHHFRKLHKQDLQLMQDSKPD